MTFRSFADTHQGKLKRKSRDVTFGEGSILAKQGLGFPLIYTDFSCRGSLGLWQKHAIGSPVFAIAYRALSRISE